MLTKQKTFEIFDAVRKHSKADETELIVSGAKSSLSRFANNTITQNVSEENYVLSVRVNLDGKTARATTNKFDDDSIRRVVESATALARVQEPDPDLLPLPAASAFGEGATASRSYPETSAMGAKERAEAVYG